jgi:mannose-6-phosphate isomerase-like protein (cupin superfamily)
MLVRDENTNPHFLEQWFWAHIAKPLFVTADGLGTLESVVTVTLDPLTIGKPHPAPNEDTSDIEEVWTSLYGNSLALVGNQLHEQTPGMAYYHIPDNLTPHTNINPSGESAGEVSLLRPLPAPRNQEVSQRAGRSGKGRRDHSMRGKAIALCTAGVFVLASMAGLKPTRYRAMRPTNRQSDRSLFADWHARRRTWRTVRLRSGRFFTHGDGVNPTQKGAVLRFLNSITTPPWRPKPRQKQRASNGQQEIYFVASGRGTATAGGQSADLYRNIAVLMPANLEFTFKNTVRRAAGHVHRQRADASWISSEFRHAGAR